LTHELAAVIDPVDQTAARVMKSDTHARQEINFRQSG